MFLSLNFVTDNILSAASSFLNTSFLSGSVKKEVTIAQKEEMIRKQLEKKELDRQRRINEAQRQEKQAISASTLF